MDACINNGRDCGLPAAEAFCKYIGFDGATPDMQQTAPADEPVRAVSGVFSCTAMLSSESYCLKEDGSGMVLHALLHACMHACCHKAPVAPLWKGSAGWWNPLLPRVARG